LVEPYDRVNILKAESHRVVISKSTTSESMKKKIQYQSDCATVFFANLSSGARYTPQRTPCGNRKRCESTFYY
jgi:hypothetical protein